MRNHYDILGIKPDATQDEIKQAYRLLSKKLHPDLNDGNTFFDEMFKGINEAYSVLGDVSKRKDYDKKLAGENQANTSNSKKETVQLDVYYSAAIALILIHNLATPSLLQRKLRVGYNQAGRIINQLERLGIIGANQDGKGHEILVDKNGAINLLSKKVGNFSTTDFLTTYNKYEPAITIKKEEPVTPSYTTPAKEVSVWDEVKTWRQVKNFMWLLNLALVLLLLYTPNKSKETSEDGTVITDERPTEVKSSQRKSPKKKVSEPFNADSVSSAPSRELQLWDSLTSATTPDDSLVLAPVKEERNEVVTYYESSYPKTYSREDFKIGEKVFWKRNKSGVILGKDDEYAQIQVIDKKGNKKTERVRYDKLTKVE